MRPDLFRSRLDILLTLGSLLLAGCSIAGEQEMAQDQKAAGQAAKPAAETNGVYGTAWGVNSLRNFEVGKTAGRQLAYRFRAATSSVPESVHFYVKTGNGYSAGTGGRLRIELRSDDGTPGHMPSNTALASGSLSDPGTGGWNQVVTLSGARPLGAGQLYHIVFLNTDPDPVANYVSINTLDNDGASPMQPGVSNEDLAVNRILQPGGGWSCVCDGATPIFALSYANGATQGQGYMDVKVSGTLPISGDNQVREIFTVSGGDRTVSRVSVRLRRTGSAGPLTVRLERNDGSVVEEGTIAASAVSTSHAWVTYNFATNHTLASGQTYRLGLKATAGGTYEIYPLQEGSNYGFSVPSMFTDGRFQYSTDGAIWTNFQGGTEFDMQFYFTVVTP